MIEQINEGDIALKKAIDRNNFIIIGLFTINLVPTITFYLDGNGEWKWFLIILAISLIFCKIPNSFIDKIQLSKRTIFYKRLKVHLFKKYATNGDIINKNIRKQFPNHRNIHTLLSIQKKLTETYTTEKAHLVFLIFSFLTSFYASIMKHFFLAIIITVGNIIFNLYPIFLQQYNRIRYNKVLANQSGIN
jgi:hypothetical protein